MMMTMAAVVVVVVVTAGWSAFVSYDHGPYVKDKSGKKKRRKFTNPQIKKAGKAPVPWRIGKGGLNEVRVTCQPTTSGAIWCNIETNYGTTSSSSMQFYWSTTGKNSGDYSQAAFSRQTVGNKSRISDANLEEMRVKRVVALTQQNDYHFDNSFMGYVNCKFFKIASGSINSQGQLIPNYFTAPEVGWPRTNVAPNPDTGYSPSGKDKRDNWIVDFNFTGIGKRNKNGLYRDNPLPARYHTWEAVTIHLFDTLPNRTVRGNKAKPSR
jgi:hypothetical protein